MSSGLPVALPSHPVVILFSAAVQSVRLKVLEHRVSWCQRGNIMKIIAAAFGAASLLALAKQRQQRARDPGTAARLGHGQRRSYDRGFRVWPGLLSESLRRCAGHVS